MCQRFSRLFNFQIVTQVVIYVLLRSPTGATQRIPATDLASVLTSANIANQLQSQMFVTNVISKVCLCLFVFVVMSTKMCQCFTLIIDSTYYYSM